MGVGTLGLTQFFPPKVTSDKSPSSRAWAPIDKWAGGPCTSYPFSDGVRSLDAVRKGGVVFPGALLSRGSRAHSLEPGLGGVYVHSHGSFYLCDPITDVWFLFPSSLPGQFLWQITPTHLFQEIPHPP